MAARSIATLSITFGLVSIPVKLYSATESAAAIRFKLMSCGGARVRQQYVADEPASEAAPDVEDPEDGEAKAPARTPRGADARVLDFPKARQEPLGEVPSSTGPAVINRADMVKGYEFEPGQFVLFTADELKALQEASRQTIDIVAFIPERSVDPIFFDKAYYLAPDKRGSKPYSLLLRAMQDTGRCALAKWAFRAKEYVVQIRAATDGMVLQQLLYAEEVRSMADLNVELSPVGEAELALARKLIEQISVDSYEPTEFVDEEKQRILAAVEEKVAGKQVVAPAQRDGAAGAQVLDLMAALRASLQPAAAPMKAQGKAATTSNAVNGERKPVKRARPRASGDARSSKSSSKG